METPEYTGQKVLYFLDIRVPEADSHRVAVISSLSIGSSDEVEVSVEEFGLAPRHGIFRVHNDILSLHNLGGSGKSSIGDQELQHGKMYLVDSGDKLSLGELEIIVRSENIGSEKDFHSLVGHEADSEVDLDELLDDATGSRDVDTEKKPKGPSLIAKIKSFFKKKKKQVSDSIPTPKKSSGEKTLTAAHSAPALKGKKNKKFLKSSEGTTAGFVGRIGAFCLNLLLTMNVISIALPLSGQTEMLNTQLTKLTNLISPLLLKVTALIPASLAEYSVHLDLLTNLDVLTFVLIFLSLQLVGVLLFGASIGHSILLIGGDGSMGANRGKGIIRWIVGIITTPFLVFDLPCLAGKKTVKEILSGTELKYRFGLAKLLSPFLILPLALIVMLALPLAGDLDRIQGSLPEDVKIIPKKLKKEPAFSGDSSLMGLHLSAIKFEDRALIPVFKKKGKRLFQQLLLLDISTSAKASLEITPNAYEKTQLIEIGLKGNPLAFHFYKNLDNALKTETLDPIAHMEFQTLVKNALSLHPESALNVLTTNGPFIQGLVNLRKFLLDELVIADNPAVTFKDVGPLQLLELKPNALSSSNITHVMPMTATEQLSLWKISFRKKAKDAGRDLKQMLLVKGKPLKKDKSDTLKRLLSEKEWGPLDILDFFNFIQTADTLAPGMAKPILNYYKFQSQLALSIGSDFFFKEVETQFRSNIKVLEELNKNKDGMGLKSLITKLKRHLNALSSKDIKYFEGRKKSVRKKTKKRKTKKKTKRSKRRRKTKRK
ncbi:MAG: hypothetical protein KC493_01295 [Bacteriovoracaceae bacterium]|nr:hypothetical protein [Bacteriovoracaceae bacterium]